MTNERMIEIMELAIEKLQEFKCNGLCYLSWRMRWYDFINENEEKCFDNYVNENAPCYIDALGYRWDPDDQLSRIQWLQQQIEILKTTTHEQI